MYSFAVVINSLEHAAIRGNLFLCLIGRKYFPFKENGNFEKTIRI
jgi:hypothetical protein